VRPYSPMKIFTFHSELWLPHPLTTVFPFFASAEHLEQLTPPFLSFHILTSQPIVIFRGRRIQYKLKIHGIPVRWESEITGWNPPHSFSDDQLHGPYRHWHHEHTFEERDGGTLVRDKVEYAVPGGTLVNRLFVAPDLRRIFNYRTAILKKLFR
jgi:ligand-binding SRPBCC domain-containing protein